MTLRLYICIPPCSASQLCPTLCSLIDCSPPGFSVHGVFQARVLEWVVISSSRKSSQPRDQIHSPALAGGFFTTEPRGPQYMYICGCVSVCLCVLFFRFF